MIIAINCRHLSSTKLEGFGTYTHEIVKRWIENHPEVNFILIFDREPTVQFPTLSNVQMIICGPPTRHPLLYWIWFELMIPSILKKTKADLFFSPDGYNSLRSSTPSITTVHDLNFEHNPKDLPRFLSAYLRYFFPRFTKKASGVLTVSNFSKLDIQHTYKIPESKIKVIYNGASDAYKPLELAIQNEIRKKITGGRPYFIYVGSLHPRKNLQRLVSAYQKINNPNADLVIVGSRMWRNHNLKIVAQNEKNIHFLGYVNQTELAEIMGSAMALTYVPYFEGFGIPMVEAMRCGTPIIAAKTTCLPEIASDTAIYCDPFDEQDIQDKMIELMGNPALQAELSRKALARGKQFSWDLCATETWTAIQTIANI